MKIQPAGIPEICQSSIRVTLFIHALTGGGAERVIVDLADYLVSHNYQVTVITLSDDSVDVYQLPGGIAREKMDIHRQSSSLIHTIIYALRQTLQLRRKVISLDTDVLVVLADKNNVRALFALIFSGIPMIISERIHPKYHLIGWKWNLARRLTYPWASLLIVQTQEIQSWCRRYISNAKIRTIPNASRNASFFAPASAKSNETTERWILSAGRLVDQKGFDMLLRAFAQSGLVAKGWRLKILGDGPLHQELMSLAAKLGVKDTVEMPGFSRNIAGLLQESSIFAFSSRFEGFPNVLMEAMQAGLPCVSTNCPGGSTGLIKDGENGFLIDVDDTNAMAQSLQALADDKALRDTFGIAAQKTALCYAPDKIYAIWERAILDVVEKNTSKIEG